MTSNQPRTSPGIVRILIAFALLIGCVAFIWSNSVQPADISSARSQAFAQFVGKYLVAIFGAESGIVAFFFRYVRKIAHALEFAMLGGTSILMLGILKRVNVNTVLHAAFLVLAVAVADETIQAFTGRGSSVLDVVLDFAGGLGGIILMLLIVNLFRLIFGKRRD